MKNGILARQVSGALKSTIKAHGRIDENRIGSATKRIVGHLNRFGNISYPDEPLKEYLLYFMNLQHIRLLDLRKKLNTVSKEKRSHIAGKHSELRNVLILLDNLLKGYHKRFEISGHPKSIDETEAREENNGISKDTIVV